MINSIFMLLVICFNYKLTKEFNWLYLIELGILYSAGAFLFINLFVFAIPGGICLIFLLINQILSAVGC